MTSAPLTATGHELPRLVIAAPGSGHGKTTIAVGVMAALARRGLSVAPAKVGPDYIDPGYHALATGRASRTLDPWLVGEERVAPLLLRGATHPAPADLAVIEGVMGLLDGRLGQDGFASTAHVAALTRSPVLLVVDISSTSRTVAATVAGMAAIDPQIDVVGVVLNKAGTDRHGAEARRAVEGVGVPVWGVVPRDAVMHVPSRHLGLVPAAERSEAAATLAHIAARAEEHLDLDALLDAARSAPALQASPWDPSAEVTATAPERPVVAVAGGRAFTFRYPETTELLEAAGAEVVEIDPSRDSALPPRCSALWVGGGFPEVHARLLATNRPLVADIARAIAAGMPTLAECAGLLYLAEQLDEHPMVGAVPARAAMGRRLTLGYREGVSVTDSVLGPAGTRVTGHEFHRTQTDPGAGEQAAWLLDGRAEGYALDPAGTGRATLVASYLHTHWAGTPDLASSFVAAAAEHASSRREGASEGAGEAPLPLRPLGGEPTRPGPHVGGRPAPLLDPLRHHGDAETGAGLIDLAVNVRSPQPPGWLAEALSDELQRIAAYPDPAPAHAAVAARHGVARDEVLLTAGGAEAFTLIARALSPRDAVVIHPQFTEPEAALRAAGHPVRHVLLDATDDFALSETALAAVGDADLVVLGNPTNPTGVLHPLERVRALLRPGRVLVVDEAFMDAVPGEEASLLGGDLTGLLVVRSLTKTWAVAGLRAGYVVGDPALITTLAAQQPHWSVGSLALRVAVETSTPQALAEAGRAAVEGRVHRHHLRTGLAELGVPVVAGEAPFVLAQTGPWAHEALRSAGWAVRRADTFPGLDDTWVRIAVRDPLVMDAFVRDLASIRAAHDLGRSA